MKIDHLTWDLSAIYPKDISKSFAEIERKVNLFEKKRILLRDSIATNQFLNLLKELEQIRLLMNRLGCAVQLKFTENSADQKAVALLSRVEHFLTKESNQLLFFSLWFKQLPDKKARELINASGPYYYFLEQLYRLKRYTLRETEEKIINIKDVTGVSALNNIYNIFTSQFRFTLEGKELTQEQLISKVRNPRAEIRKKAYVELLSKYKTHKDVLGEIYKNIVDDWREEHVTLRGYNTPLQVRNIANDIPDQAIEALLNVCERNQAVFQKYFELKRKKLKLKKMSRFDLYAPLNKSEPQKISYDEAVKMVLEVFNTFSPQFKQAALQILNNHHVHAKIQPNKQSGAFCMSVNAKLPPYVLLNYDGGMRDISTLAHELGHGVHHVLAAQHTEFTFHSCLPLAETASVFSEMILSEKLMEKYPHQAKELLFFKLDEMYATITRQAGFILFEKKAHEMIGEGRTVDELSSEWLKGLKEQLGPKIKVDDLFSNEWAYIPHIFHTPFYCYAYFFGNLLTLALYEKYKKDHSFNEKIIEMLAMGGSASPLEITKKVGVDITSEKFWQQGFDAIKEMIQRIEK